MPDSFTVKVEGLRELEAALSQLPKAVAKATLVRVLKKAAEPIREAAERAAPVRDPGAPDKYYGGAKVGKGHTRPEGQRGKLRRTGTDKALWQAGTRLTRRQAGNARKEGKDFAEYYVGSRDPIARLLEYGTANAAPHPMIRPAWASNKDRALETIKEELGGEIAKSAQRLAKRAAKGK